jgi:hypothetical protein
MCWKMSARFICNPQGLRGPRAAREGGMAQKTGAGKARL